MANASTVDEGNEGQRNLTSRHGVVEELSVECWCTAQATCDKKCQELNT